MQMADSSMDRNAYFGDLHVHTALSFDAAGFGTTATPADAYRYAQGEAIMHPSGFEVQLAQPLDFYAVTDHASMLGLINEAADTNTAFSEYEHQSPITASMTWSMAACADLAKNLSSTISAVMSYSLLDGTS